MSYDQNSQAVNLLSDFLDGFLDFLLTFWVKG
jgi:hypothetical protein